MPLEETEGVVIRGIDFSESSRIVTFLTPQRGRVVCMAKGIRRPKSALGPLLDNMNRVELQLYWKESRSIQILSDVALLDSHGPIKKDLDKLTTAALPIEIASRTAHDNEPSEALYATLVNGLHDLTTWEGDALTHACWLSLHLLAAGGFAPALDRCSLTGRTDLGSRPGFTYSCGVVATGQPRDRAITPEALATLHKLMLNDDTCPSVKITWDTFTLLRHYAARQLETDLRSARVLEQLYGDRASAEYRLS